MKKSLLLLLLLCVLLTARTEMNRPLKPAPQAAHKEVSSPDKAGHQAGQKYEPNSTLSMRTLKTKR
jgi:hypothetical protein